MGAGLTWTKSSSHGWIVITGPPHPYRDPLEKKLNKETNLLKINKLQRMWANNSIAAREATNNRKGACRN
jgi:hypothetical protein